MIAPAALAVFVGAFASDAFAQLHYRTDKPPPRVMPQAGPTCGGFTVDTQVAIRRSSMSSEASAEQVDFVVTASVGNPCEAPLQVRQGSMLAYETNFPFSVAGGGQSPSCQSREFAFAGVVPPRSQQPFTLAVRSCAVDPERGERPTVAVSSGRVLTNRGERAVPLTSQTLP